MVHSESKAPQKRTVFVVALITCAVIFVVILLSNNDGELSKRSVATVADPTLEQQAIILSIVSSKEPLTDEQRDTLFSSLSGPRMLQYNFTGSEKDLIVKALNAANAPKATLKKNSSALLFSVSVLGKQGSWKQAIFRSGSHYHCLMKSTA